MLRRSTGSTIILVLVALLATPVSAATITGNTGLINMPNADALRPSTIEMSGRLINNSGVLGLNIGIVPQVEVGVYSVTSTNDIGLTLKGVLVPESGQTPGIAAGLEDKDLYLVFSKSFSNIRGHFGFGSGRFNGPFFGLSMMLNRASISAKGGISPVTTLMIEHDGHWLNAGARIALTPQMKVDLAFLNMEQAMLGISFNTSM